MVHGRMANTKNRTARLTSAPEISAFFFLWNHNHSSRKGIITQRDGFVSAAAPQSRPYPDQCRGDADSRIQYVIHSRSAISSAARLWSQSHSIGMIIATGDNAHNQAAPTPVGRP